MTARLVRWYDNGRGPRIVVEIVGQDVVFDVRRATQLRDALTRKLDEVAAGKLDDEPE